MRYLVYNGFIYGGVMGRPTIYSEDLCAELCKRLSLGESLNQICKDEHMPNKETVFAWIREDKHGFSDKYREARELQQEHYLDEMIEIADDSSNDFIKTENGEKLNSEHVQRSKLRIETRRWIMERLAAKKYGSKTELDHKSSDGSMATPKSLNDFYADVNTKTNP